MIEHFRGWPVTSCVAANNGMPIFPPGGISRQQEAKKYEWAIYILGKLVPGTGKKVDLGHVGKGRRREELRAGLRSNLH